MQTRLIFIKLISNGSLFVNIHTKLCTCTWFNTKVAASSRCSGQVNIWLLRCLRDVRCSLKTFHALFCSCCCLLLWAGGHRKVARIWAASGRRRFYRGVHIRWWWALTVHLGAGEEAHVQHTHTLIPTHIQTYWVAVQTGSHVRTNVYCLIAGATLYHAWHFLHFYLFM